jgi:PAS domain S-box-containing protein
MMQSSKIISFEKNERVNTLIKVPPRMMGYLVAILGLTAMFIELKYYPQFSKEIYIVRLATIAIALGTLSLLNIKSKEAILIAVFHFLSIVVVISSGLMIYLIPSSLLLNSSIIGLMIFTSALYLSWEIGNQIIVAVYYNTIFAAALLLTNQKTYFFPFMTESLLFVLVLSIVSVVASAVNYKLKVLEDEKNSEIKKSEYKYRSIIDNSLEGIFQTTPEGKWLTINKSFAQILGYDDEKELLSLDVNDIYVMEQDRKILIDELEKHGKVENYRIRLKRKDGSIAVVRLNDRIVKDENGFTFFEGNIYDITDQVKADEKRQQFEEMLKLEKEKTEKLAQEAMRISGTKSKFLANLSHEIRTPMNGILGFLTLIEAGAYSNEDELKLFSSNARQSAESLLDIINSILDLSKIEAGKVKVENVRFNLMSVIDQSISVISIKAKEKNIRIIKEIPGETESFLVGDMIKFRQILINLLNNAVKFTSDGEIRVTVKTKKAPDKKVDLFVTVTDTGIGIPASKINDLFKPYSQIDGFYDNLTSGTGLGLVICKEYVELLGGTISVTSKQGEGSSFIFSIKCKAESEIDLSDKIEHAEEAHENLLMVASDEFNGNGYKNKRKKFNLLLAEDNLINQKVTIKILNTFGFNVKAVSDGHQAVKAVMEGDFDLILMDLQMPNLDGFKATEQIRSFADSRKDIPIIALTAHALLGDKEKCLSAGMTDYVSKPISGQDLVKKIDVLLNIRTETATYHQVSAIEKNILLDQSRLKKVSLGDHDFEKDLLTSYLSDLDLKYNLLNKLIAKNDIKKIVEIAHSIKGSSYSIGADRVGDEAFAIELSGKNNDWLNVNDRIEKLGVILNETKLKIESYLANKKPSGRAV